ncbi:hypothetical protein BDW42DRAFT_189235 [Aspergillus taichungensis]|uniref:Uncharacterized protein n=1 Tax=Aspergillus taichungensis TaxID=482145 RepID=A0A2J5HF16_9EURO|nr:hypothetical protein BDW42DRAFT_189235 [Aspergillus taichungensis]
MPIAPGYYIGCNTVINLDPEAAPCREGVFQLYMFVPMTGVFLTLAALLETMLSDVKAGEGFPTLNVDARVGGVWFRFEVTEEGLDQPRLHLEAMAELKTRILRLTINLDRGFTRCQVDVFRRYMFVPLTGYYLTLVSLLQAMISTVSAGEGILTTGIDVMRAGGVWFRFDVIEEGLVELRLRLEAMAELKMRILRLMGR